MIHQQVTTNRDIYMHVTADEHCYKVGQVMLFAYVSTNGNKVQYIMIYLPYHLLTMDSCRHELSFFYLYFISTINIHKPFFAM